MFTDVINDLLLSGLTEAAIADLVNVSPPTINRIKRGRQIPLYPLGAALLRLRDERIERPPHETQAEAA